jgi:hypothetical protein
MPTETPTAPAASEPKTATLDAPSAGEKAPSDFMADIVGDLEALSAGQPEPKRDDKGKFKPAEKPVAKQPDKPKAKAPETPVEKPEEKTPEPEPEKATEKAPEVKPVKAAELRTAYEGLKKRVKDELEPEVQRLRSKVQEFESKKPEDAAPLVEKIKTLEQRNAQLEKQIEYVDYTNSTDFKTKYHEPYRQEWNEAVAEFNQLKVIERQPDGVDDMGEPKFKITKRPATEADLIQLGAMELSDMDEAADRMFGKSAPRAINRIQNLRKLAAARNKAQEEAQTRATEWKSQQSAEAQIKSQMLSKTWQEVNKNLEERLPLAFKPDETDDADKEAYTRGFALADLLFRGENSLSPEQAEVLPAGFKDTVKAKQPLTDEQRVQLHALARMQMGNSYRQLSKLKKATDRIKELETALAEYEKSEPDASKAGAGEAKATTKDWLEEAGDELRAIDR